jgi:large subunit ribosomal protein L20
MARVKGAINSRKRHKRTLKAAKGFYGARSTQYRSAKSAVMRAQRYAFAGRRMKKRDFRQLWIARINAACHMNDISYSRFMFGLKQGGITLNRKVLADIAVNDPAGFTKLVETAKAAL